MKNVKLTYQNYGSSILIFIQGATQEAAHGRYLSLWNWNATSSDENYVANNVIAVWSTIDKLQQYFFNLRLVQLSNVDDAIPMTKDERKANGMKRDKEARLLAAADFAEVETESFRSVNSNYAEYSMGTITAEKPDDDFKDSVMAYAFSNK
jgi:hypothetical protein